MTITVQQAIEARAKLEGAILLALERFRIETDLTVTSINLHTVTLTQLGLGERKMVERVTVKVEL